LILHFRCGKRALAAVETGSARRWSLGRSLKSNSQL